MSVDLINWLAVLRNALWIFGLSVILATWSYTRWWAANEGIRMRTALVLPMFLVPCYAGLVLFATSLAWGADQVWERALWVLLGLYFLWEVYSGWRQARLHGWKALNLSVPLTGHSEEEVT